MKAYIRLVLLSLFILSTFIVKAQVPTNADCLGAIPVCQSVYVFSSSVHGTGNYTDIPVVGAASTNNCPGSCISAGEQNTTWFIFTTQTAGLINFTITPISSGDDYDWAVYNISTNGCSDIYNGGMQVSCNYCMNTGSTGPNGGGGNWCEGPNGCNQYNAPIPSAANTTYVLMVDNFSSSNSGYTLNFSASSASIFDNTPPQLTTLSTPISCGASTLNISFSEYVQCNTVSTGDFTVTGPGGPYTVSYVSGAACLVGGTQEMDYTLTVIPDMTTPGNYQLNLVNTAGSVADLCGNIAPATTIPFTITGPNVSVSPSSSTICNGASVTLTASGATSYAWGPSTGLSATTGTSVTATPSTTTSYTVIGTQGSCTAGAIANINVNPAPVITLTSNPASPVCNGTVVTIDASSNMPGTSFSWSTLQSGPQITPTVNSSTTYTVTGTSSGCSASQTITINSFAPSAITVTPASPVICNSQSTTLTASGSSNYTWSPPTGLSTTSGASVTANPTATTTYTVSGGSVGCTAQATATVTVNAMPTATVTGGGNLCSGSTVTVPVSIALTGTPPWNITYTNGTTSTTVNGINTSPYTFNTSSGGIYTVTSITDANCPGSSNGAAIVNLMTLPSVSLPVLGPACINAPAFALSGGTPAGGTYSGPGVTANTFTPSTAGAGVHNIIYTYTDGNGCTNRDTNTLTVNALPTVTLAAQNPVCLNTPAFALSGGSPAGGVYTGTGVAGSIFTAANAGTGSHTITYTYTDANSCTNTATASITVNALPVVSFTALPPVCIDSAAFPLAGGSPAGGTYSGTGVSNNIFDPAVSGAGTFNVTYSYTDPTSQCSNTAVQPQVVNPLPFVTLAPFANTCISTPSFLLSGGMPTGGTYSGPSIVNNVFDPAVAGLGTHTITYTYTDPTTGCMNSTDTTITVILGIGVTVNPVSSNICKGSSLTLTASGADSYTWTPSTGLTSTVGSAVIATPPNTITYTVTGTNSDGCSGQAMAIVNLYPPVNIAFQAVPPTGCKPLNVQFLFNTTPDIQDSSWHWNFGDILSEDDTSGLEDPTHTYIEEGNYTASLTVTTANGCVVTSTMPINVYNKPIADFFWTPEVGNMENPEVFFVDASVGASYWYWNFGDPASGNSNESNVNNPTHVFSDSGTYQISLIVEANHGCSDTAIKYFLMYPQTLIFVPNAFTPDNNQLNDVWGPTLLGVRDDGFELSVWDRWGKAIFRTSVPGEGWDGKVGGKVAPSGVYVWVLKYRDPSGKDYKRKGTVTIVR